MTSNKRIVIVDDHTLFRKGLKAIIGNDNGFEVTGEAGNAADGLLLAGETRPDIMIIDITLPDKDGIKLTREVRHNFPEIRIMIVSMHSKTDYIVEASFCEKTNCHSTTMTYVVFIFTTDQQDQINFITDLNLGLDAKVTNITKDGIITIENHEYAENDPSCCPSIVNTQSYALVGKKLALLAIP